MMSEARSGDSLDAWIIIETDGAADANHGQASACVPR
jgi:hypothetical protein